VYGGFLPVEVEVAADLEVAAVEAAASVDLAAVVSAEGVPAEAGKAVYPNNNPKFLHSSCQMHHLG